jgi:hypothetical protein
MSGRFWHRTLGLMGVAVLLCGAAAVASAPEGEGWVALFNGKDLNNWVQRNGKATYHIEDDAIVGTTKPNSPNSFLCTKEQYGDFELVFEVKVDNELNSGVQIRSRSKGDYKNYRVHGPQVEIESAPGESGYIYSEGTGRGWLSQDRSTRDAFNNNEWNKYRVKAKGDRIQTWVNGKKIEDIKTPDSYKKGFIGLQVHGVGGRKDPLQVRWRNLYLRKLD